MMARVMTTLTLTLDANTVAWLQREAATTRQTPADLVVELLQELADPDSVEGDLIDRLLTDATGSFPPVMTLDEQSEMREELLDDLCRRLVETDQQILGEPMTRHDQARFRKRLEEQSQHCWS